MRVLYDRKNDIVSVYFEVEEEKGINNDDSTGEKLSTAEYSVDEAANLLIDMVDLTDKRGDLKGFRVFNASKYYDTELLDAADEEQLTGEEIACRPSEKVIGVFTKNNKV